MRIEIPAEKQLVHETRVPIRWGDMDAYRHVNNTIYFRFMEQARIEWISLLQQSTHTEDAGMLMVNGFCNFYQQLSYPGELIVKTYVGAIGRTSMDVYNAMFLTSAPEVKVAEGGATMVWVDLITDVATPWPEAILAGLR